MRRWKASLALALALSACAVTIFLPTRVGAYAEPTHAAMTERAARTVRPGTSLAVIDAGLVNMGFDVRLDTIVAGEAVVTWLRAGVVLEDVLPRWLNQFHNPLADWNVAGLSQIGQSSVLWAQNPDPMQSWSWATARQQLYDALTIPTQAQRDQALARMLRALGHQVHFVQDAASPAHTRNDPHPPASTTRSWSIPFEFVSQQRSRRCSEARSFRPRPQPGRRYRLSHRYPFRSHASSTPIATPALTLSQASTLRLPSNRRLASPSTRTRTS
jgi:hypothetical protein